MPTWFYIWELYFVKLLRQPAHHARGTVSILAHAAPDFIAPDLWLLTITAADRLQDLRHDAGERLLHADTQRCWSEAVSNCCAVWSAAASHQWCVDSCTPVWELMGVTSNSFFDTLKCLWYYWLAEPASNHRQPTRGQSPPHRTGTFVLLVW